MKASTAVLIAILIATCSTDAAETDIAGLHAWYRSEGLKTSGAAVVAWENSAKGVVPDVAARRHLNRIVGQPRAFRVAAPAGERTVLRLDGHSALWQAAGDWGSLAEGRTVIVVARLTKETEGFLFDGSTNSGLTRAQVRAGKWQAGVQPPPISNAANEDATTQAAEFSTWQVHGFVFEKRDSSTRVTHFLGASGDADELHSQVAVSQGTSPLSGLIVGANATTKLGLKVDLAEMQVFDRALSPSEQKQVATELRTRWGQSVDLPADKQPKLLDIDDDPRLFRQVLRKPGDDGSKAYRIPGLATTLKGTLLAVFDVRHDGGSDLPADIDVGLMRSTDDGTTWSPMQRILDYDKAEPNSRGNGVGDPAILVDSQTGAVFVAALWSKGNRAWNGSGPGMTPEETGQFVITKSLDDGVTWSPPINITQQIKAPEWRLCFNGPGAGITTRDGTLVFPAQFREANGTAHSCFIYSRDHGSSWTISPAAIPGQRPTSESQITELEDGSLLLTMRDESRSGKRAWAKWTWDKPGKSTRASDSSAGRWSEPWFTNPDPTCMASLLRHPSGELLFSNPNSATQRIALTIRTSVDGGRSWSEGRLLDPRGCMYSCLTVLKDGRIGILYEVAGTLTFARFPLDWVKEKAVVARPAAAFSIPVIDLNGQKERQFLVDREAGQYLGHPTTLLLEDGKTILCVYPKGHGRGPIILKRSDDGGRSWSDRLPTPKNWETSLETPTIHRMVDAKAKRRVILFSGLNPARMAISEDDGRNWSELKAIGDWGGIVTMSSVVELTTAGHYLALFHDDGRFIKKGGKATSTSTLYKTLSTDGGLTWSEPEAIFGSNKVFLCEPGAIRSPDSKQIAVLLRENFHKKNSHVIFSDDEGRTWTEPRELAASLNGDRHVARYGPDGRLFVSFRDIPTKGQYSPTAGDWVGWVGTYDDLVNGTEGQHRIRLRHNYGNSSNDSTGDCGYAGVELLPDGTFVVVTYGHWDLVPGSTHPQHPEGRGQPPYILCVRFTLDEIDQLAKKPPASALADPLSLNELFTDSMVFQRDIPVPVWGTATAGIPVTVTIGNQFKEVKTDENGNWTVMLDAMKADAEPRELKVVAGQETLVVRDVLIGDVWIAAGQSNMEFAMSREAHASVELSKAEYAQIRFLNLTYAGQYHPARKFGADVLKRLKPDTFYQGKWQPCSPQSAKEFSAVGYYFGKEIHQTLKVPVGVIHLAVGGSPTEAWIRRDAIATEPKLKSMVAGNWLDNPELGEWCLQRAHQNLDGAIKAGQIVPGDELGWNHPFKPAFLWESGISRLIPFGIRGVIWYQGESNSLSLRRVEQHSHLFPLLVADWRAQWGLGDFPFLYCQLSGIGTEGGYKSEHWPEFRDSQRRMLAEIPNAGMAVTSDLGHPTDVHPRNKRDVGQRLARWALAKTYQQPMEFSGPIPANVISHDGQLVIKFDHADGLTTSDGQAPHGFEIGEAQGEFHQATAVITDSTITLSSPLVSAPVRVRYAWQPYPNANVVNAAKLPASTFEMSESRKP